MDQHILSKWLIKRFARPTKAGERLTAYHKPMAAYSLVAPRRFLAPKDDHSRAIEQQLARIESPAAEATRLLHSLAEAVPSGLCRIGDPVDPDHDAPTAGVRPGGRAAGFELLVVEAQIARLPAREQEALAKFAALMFTRAPKVDRAMREYARLFSQGVATALVERGLSASERAIQELQHAVEYARWQGLREADRYAEQLIARQWWLLKAAPGQEFVLGDTPVVATLALGHDDEWRPLFHAEAMIVIAPLGPSLALLIAHAIPVGGGSLDFVGSINRLSWKHADEYVIGTSESKIEEVRTDLVAHGWRESAPLPVPDEEAVIMRGRRFSAQWSADWAWRQNLLPGRPIQIPASVPAWVELAEEKQLPRGRLFHVP